MSPWTTDQCYGYIWTFFLPDQCCFIVFSWLFYPCCLTCSSDYGNPIALEAESLLLRYISLPPIDYVKFTKIRLQSILCYSIELFIHFCQVTWFYFNFQINLLEYWYQSISSIQTVLEICMLRERKTICTYTHKYVWDISSCRHQVRSWSTNSFGPYHCWDATEKKNFKWPSTIDWAILRTSFSLRAQFYKLASDRSFELF